MKNKIAKILILISIENLIKINEKINQNFNHNF
jgi:hypothetical protein